MPFTTRSEALDAAAANVERSESTKGLGGELNGIRDALRALIQWAEDMERRLPKEES